MAPSEFWCWPRVYLAEPCRSIGRPWCEPGRRRQGARSRRCRSRSSRCSALLLVVGDDGVAGLEFLEKSVELRAPALDGAWLILGMLGGHQTQQFALGDSAGNRSQLGPGKRHNAVLQEEAGIGTPPTCHHELIPAASDEAAQLWYGRATLGEFKGQQLVDRPLHLAADLDLNHQEIIDSCRRVNCPTWEMFCLVAPKSSAISS